MDQHVIKLLEQLHTDFESNNGDVEIRVVDQTFNVSRQILCLRSPVFAAMFQNNTKEKQTNVIEINEFDAELMEKFLLYLYTAKIDDLDEDAMELFKISDYYNVKLLRETCLEHMLQNVDEENATEYFELADKYSLKDLKMKAIDFIHQNIDEFSMFTFYEFAKKHSLNDLENKVVDFIEVNLAKVVKKSEWKRFDSDFRHKMLQEFFDDGPLLEVHDKTLFAEKTSITVDGQNIELYTKCYTLKNIGNKSLYFKVGITNKIKDPDAVKIYGCWPENGKIEPNESLNVTVQFKSTNFLVSISYEAAGKKKNEEHFEQNALVNQITISPSTHYLSSIK